MTGLLQAGLYVIFQDLTLAVWSLKPLADYLERHPDALLRGKGGPESK
jgi:hypothetical protein